MSLLPDPAELDAIADRINRHASAARARAEHLGRAVAGADWRGLAADAFHGEAHVAISGLRSAAGRLDDAADALRRHARKVGAIVDDLAVLGVDSVGALTDLVTDPGALLSDGKKLLSDGAGLVGDTLSLVGL
jgi:hypothetical protein